MIGSVWMKNVFLMQELNKFDENVINFGKI